MVVTEHKVPPVAVTERNLRSYEEVVERLMERQTILPARFGTTLAEPQESLAILDERRDELRAGLDGVRGAVELGVQGRWRSDQPRSSEAPPHGPPLPGTEYLKSRLARQHRISQVQERLRPLRSLSQGSRAPALPRSDLAFAAAYLVPRSNVERFVQLAAQLGEQLDDVELEVTGPWPPYSFVSGEVT
jgi:hypothetical protein